MKRTYKQNKAKANRMNKRRFMRHHRELKTLQPINLFKHYELLKEQAEARGEWEIAYVFYTQMVECV